MHSREGDPQPTDEAAIGLAHERRRAGRLASVHPQLRNLLRGQIDPHAPPDPVLPPPTRRHVDATIVLGAVVIAGLLLAGVALRFAV